MGANGHMKKGELRDKVLGYVKKHPSASTAEVTEALGGSRTYVGRVLNRSRCSNPTHQLSNSRAKMSVALDVSSLETEVKVLDGVRVIGTVVLGQHGITYRKANAKKPTGRRLSWAILEKLSQLGFE